MLYLSYGLFVTISDILSSYKLLNQNKEYFCFPSQFPSSIFRSFTIDTTKVKPVYPENELKRTQDLKTTVYFDCGQFYLAIKENLQLSKIHSNGLDIFCQIESC